MVGPAVSRRRGSVAHGALFGPLLALMIGCGDVGFPERLDEYQQIPDAASLDLTTVTPGVAADYWEFRLSFGASPDSVLAAAGPVARSALSATARATLDTLGGRSGFGLLCPPGDCSRYLVSVRGDSVRLWTDVAQVRLFLGTITSEVEAILLTAAHGYTWTAMKQIGGIRRIANGYELLVRRLVEICDPVQVNRYLVRVAADGGLTIEQEEVFEQEFGVCI